MLSHKLLAVADSPAIAKDPKIDAVLRQSQPGVVTYFPTNALIYAQGDKSGPLYLVEFGTVRVCRVTPDGRRQITSFCLAGDVFGLEGGDEHEFSAESVDGAGVRVLRPRDPARFAPCALDLALRGLARLQKHLLVLGRLGANEKVAQYLIDLMERRGGDEIIDLPMQRSDIADYLGLTFETVSRALRTLKDRGIIRLNSVSQVVVLDESALAQMAV